MGRKKKYLNDDKRDALLRTSSLMREIKQASQLTAGDLAEALQPEIVLSEDLVRQYLAGKKKVMGEDRQIALARIARQRGWEGPLVRYVLKWNEDLYSKDERQMLTELSSTMLKKRSADRRSALKFLEKGARILLGQGMTDADLVGLMIMLAEKLVPAHERTGGGMINPAGLRVCVGFDYSSIDDAWLYWDILPLEDAAEYVKKKSSRL